MFAEVTRVVTQSQIDWHNTIIYSIIATLVCYVVLRIVRQFTKKK